MKVGFWGAAGTVTGSRYVVDTDGGRLLVDCGLFQGLKPIRSRNWAPFAVAPETIDAVVLTHAHLDHSGYLPALVRDGFKGSVWCTPATAALAGILLPDSAHLQEEEARYANRKKSSRHNPALPLYTSLDAEVALDRLRTQRFGHVFFPVPGVSVTFSPVGHILGAACVRVDDGSTSVLFSGDVGRPVDPIMRPPEPPLRADHVVIESTYGNRRHPDEDPLERLAEVVTTTIGRGGTVLIPTFAVGRAQTLLYLLARLREDGRLRGVPVFLNSPMAINATELYWQHAGEHRLSESECRKVGAGVKLVRTVEESIELTSSRTPSVILSASGMASGGRVLHHLIGLAPDPRNTILFVGFQAAGTRGEAMLAGADHVRIFGADVPVRAQVAHIDGLSAHADVDELSAWLSSAVTAPRTVHIVHGEPPAAAALAERIRRDHGWDTSIPAHGDSVVLGSDPDRHARH